MASESLCNIEKSRLISLLENHSFDPSRWNGEVIHKGFVFQNLGSPLRVDCSKNPKFNWVWDWIQRKLKRWEFVLLSFHSRVKIINAYMISLVLFNSPLLKMAKKHWKEFHKPIKKLQWRNSTRIKTPWHCCSWEKAATPKEYGVLGILDPILHAKAM